MPDDVRELPARDDSLSRFLGGSPLAVLLRLVLLSVLVGVVLAAIGFDPWNIVSSIRRLFEWIYKALETGDPYSVPANIAPGIAQNLEAWGSPGFAHSSC